MPTAWAFLLAGLLLGPALGPGYVLTYDMVWVPDLALRSDFLGLGSGLPRAVPSDAVVAVLDELVPGDLLQKLVLVGALGLAGMGARRLVPADSLTAQLAATSFYVWSPFVAERLGIGHWPLLLTYAALPWLYDAARRARAGEPTTPATVLWLGLASLSAAGGVIAGFFAMCCVVGRRRGAVRRSAVVAAAVVAVNAPWMVAGALHGSGALSDPSGVEAFAARGEGVLPLPLTLLGLGGIWNAEVVPGSRTGWAAVVALVLTVGVGVAGVRRWSVRVRRRDRLGLLAAAVGGILVALAGSVVPDAVAWLVSSVPGGGLVRDGSRFVALVAPLATSIFGVGVAAVVDRLPARGARIAVASALVLAPLALMPDLGMALGGRLQPADYPAEYAAARAAVEARRAGGGKGGDVLLLPFSSYRLPSWNDGRRTLDPLGRYLTPDYLVSDVLYVSDIPIAGEDERAARVAELLDEGLGTDELARALGEQGIAWVALDKEAAAVIGDAAPSADLTDLPVVHDGARIVVWELPRPVPPTSSTGSAVAVAVAWCVAGGALVASAVLVVVRFARTRSARPRK